ncbi:hypothetical protein ACFWAY_39285 [Rhodococcus sp. NPDC059968]|uniref:hypothetical protein n=1 Tax=Rhodococcus sp. NPDC059968 TaxID=3347017 RepID=UPI00366AA90D
MGFRETVACAGGVVRLGVDAGIALMSMAIAVPGAFAIGEATAMASAARGLSPAPATPPPESKTHDLGTIVTPR